MTSNIELTKAYVKQLLKRIKELEESNNHLTQCMEDVYTAVWKAKQHSAQLKKEINDERNI